MLQQVNDNTPQSGKLSAEFFKPGLPVLSTDNQAIQSWIGYRDGTPEPKRSKLLNGTDNHIDISNSVVTALTTSITGAFSIWVNFADTTPASQSQIISYGDTNANTEIAIYLSTSGLVVARCISAGTVQWEVDTDAAPLTDSTWHHIVVTQDGTAPVIYVDNVEVAQTFTTTTDQTAWFNDLTGIDNGYIGANNINSAGLSNYSAANVFDARVFTSDLSVANIDTVYRFGDVSSLAHYKLDDQNVDLIDSSGNFYNATLSGTLTSVYYEGADVPYSFQNEYGFTISDGSTYYYDTGGVDLIPSGELITRDESNPTKCCAYDSGGTQQEILNKGKIKERAKITNVNVGSTDGVDRYVSVNNPYFWTESGNLKPVTIRWKGVITSAASNVFVCSNLASSLNGNWRIYRSANKIRFDISNGGSFGITGQLTSILTTNTFTSTTEPLDIVITFDGSSTSSIKIYINGTNESYTVSFNNFTGSGSSYTYSIGRRSSATYDQLSPFIAQVISAELTSSEVTDLINDNYTILSNFKLFWSFNEGSGSTVYDLSPNANHGTWNGTLTADAQYTKSDEAINYLMVNGVEVYDDDATGTEFIYVPFANDGTPISPTISGYSLLRTVQPFNRTGEFTNDYDCEIDFSYYENLDGGLPAAYTEGDTLPNIALIDRSGTNIETKLIIAKEDISADQLFKDYTQTA